MFLCPDLVNIFHKNTFDPYFILRSVIQEYKNGRIIMWNIIDVKLVMIVILPRNNFIWAAEIFKKEYFPLNYMYFNEYISREQHIYNKLEL